MEIPRCKSCTADFDSKFHRPQILPKCGHSMCVSCINSSIGRTGKLVCPEDFTSYEDPALEDFPPNNAILMMLERSVKTCPEHGKPLEFFCATDQAEICAECGLFGVHRTHQIAPFKELQKLNEKGLKGLRDSLAPYATLIEAKEGGLASQVKEAMRRARKVLLGGYKKLKSNLKEHVFGSFEKLEKQALEKFVTGGENSLEQARLKLVYLSKNVGDLSSENRSGDRATPKIAGVLEQLKTMFKESSEQFVLLQSFLDAFATLTVELKVDYEKIYKSIVVDTDQLKRLTIGKLEESQLLLQTFTDINHQDLFIDSCMSSPSKSTLKSKDLTKPNSESSCKKAIDDHTVTLKEGPLSSHHLRTSNKMRSGSEKNTNYYRESVTFLEPKGKQRERVQEPSFKKIAGMFRQSGLKETGVFQSVIGSPFLSSKTKNTVLLRDSENLNLNLNVLNTRQQIEKRRVGAANSPLLEYAKKCKSSQPSPNLQILKQTPHFMNRGEHNNSMDGSFNKRARPSVFGSQSKPLGQSSSVKAVPEDREPPFQVVNLKNITVTREKLSRFLVNIQQSRNSLFKVVFQKVVFDCDPIALLAETFSSPLPQPLVFDFRGSNVFLTPLDSQKALVARLNSCNVRTLF